MSVWRARDIFPLSQVLQCVFSVFQWQQRQHTGAETLGYPHLVLRPVWGRTLSFQKIFMNSCSGTGVKLALCSKPQYRKLTSTEVFGSCYVYRYKTRKPLWSSVQQQVLLGSYDFAVSLLIACREVGMPTRKFIHNRRTETHEG